MYEIQLGIMFYHCSVCSFALILIAFIFCLYSSWKSWNRGLEISEYNSSDDFHLRPLIKSKDSLRKDLLLSTCRLALESNRQGFEKYCINFVEKSDLNVNEVEISSGLNIFQCACLSGNVSLMKYLMHKANFGVKTSHQDTLLHLAVYGILHSNSSYLDFGTLSTFVSRGIDINSQNNAGFTVLHFAATFGNMDMISFLLDQGADPRIKTRSNICPKDCAQVFGHHEVVTQL